MQNRWNEDVRYSMIKMYSRLGMQSEVSEARKLVVSVLERSTSLSYLKRQAAVLVEEQSRDIEAKLNAHGFSDFNRDEEMYFKLGVYQMFDTWINSFDDGSQTGPLYAQSDEYEEVTTTTTTAVEYEETHDNGGGSYSDFYDRGYSYGR